MPGSDPEGPTPELAFGVKKDANSTGIKPEN